MPDFVKMIKLELTEAENKTIALLVGNLMASAFDADLDPGVLESIYYKASQYLEE
jgi:hypothetical protein